MGRKKKSGGKALPPAVDSTTDEPTEEPAETPSFEAYLVGGYLPLFSFVPLLQTTATSPCSISGFVRPHVHAASPLPKGSTSKSLAAKDTGASSSYNFLKLPQSHGCMVPMSRARVVWQLCCSAAVAAAFAHPSHLHSISTMGMASPLVSTPPSLIITVVRWYLLFPITTHQPATTANMWATCLIGDLNVWWGVWLSSS
jgi:hypothetical protein